MNTFGAKYAKQCSRDVSQNEKPETYGIHWKTLCRILKHERPPGYQIRVDREKPVIGPYLQVVKQLVEEHENGNGKRLTANKIYERLREEHGYAGCLTIVQNAVRQLRKEQ